MFFDVVRDVQGAMRAFTYLPVAPIAYAHVVVGDGNANYWVGVYVCMFAVVFQHLISDFLQIWNNAKYTIKPENINNISIRIGILVYDVIFGFRFFCFME